MVLLLNMLSPYSLTVQKVKASEQLKLLFQENFNNYTGGKPASLAIGTGTEIKMTASNIDAEHGTSLTISPENVTAYKDVYILKSFGATKPISGKIVAEISVRAEDTVNKRPIFIMKDNTAVKAIENYFLRFNDNGKIVTVDALGNAAVDIQPYVAGEWYKLKLEIDTTTKKYDLYINGIKMVDQFTVPKPEFLNIVSFKLQA